MRPHDPHTRPPHRCSRPGLERLESRALLSSRPLGALSPGRHPPAADVAQFVPVLYPAGTPQPTPAEVQRESFVNKSVGRYVIGPGRFNTQQISIHGYGKESSSNLSRVSRFQYLIFEPTDRSNPVVGAINFMPANITASGANIVLDLEGPTGTEVNGLPTHLYWVNDYSSGADLHRHGDHVSRLDQLPRELHQQRGCAGQSPAGLPGRRCAFQRR